MYPGHCHLRAEVIFNNSREKFMSIDRFIVTGSSSGIGKAICEALIAKKIRVIGISRNEARHYFDPAYYESHLIDLADTKNLPTRLTSVIEKYGQFNGLISCAGVGNFGSIENFSLMQIEESLRINLLSHIVLTRYLVPLLKKQNGGNLIYIGSEAALDGGKQGSLYSAAKFGLRGFTQSIRAEVAHKNIKVVLINPGMVRTPFFDKLHFEPGSNEQNTIPVDDIAKVVINVLEMTPNTSIDEVVINPIIKSVTKKKINNSS